MRVMSHVNICTSSLCSSTVENNCSPIIPGYIIIRKIMLKSQPFIISILGDDSWQYDNTLYYYEGTQSSYITDIVSSNWHFTYIRKNQNIKNKNVSGLFGKSLELTTEVYEICLFWKIFIVCIVIDDDDKCFLYMNKKEPNIGISTYIYILFYITTSIYKASFSKY